MKDKIKEKALIIQFIDETKTPKPKTKTHEAYSWFYQKYSEWLEDRLSTPSVTDDEKITFEELKDGTCVITVKGKNIHNETFIRQEIIESKAVFKILNHHLPSKGDELKEMTADRDKLAELYMESQNDLARLSSKSDELVEIEQPIGDFIINNAKCKPSEDGMYYHYADVCELLHKYREALKEKGDEYEQM